MISFSPGLKEKKGLSHVVAACVGAAWARLGHRSVGIADTYAKLDHALAIEAARKLG